MSSDVKITVFNKTDSFQNIVIFQQQDELNQMFDNLFPIAWKVFPLKGIEDGEIRKGYTTYPIAQTIGVTRNPANSDNLPFGILEITARADNGEQFNYYIDEHGAQDIEKLPTKNDDSSVSCNNDSNELTSIVYAKNGSNLVVQKDVPKGDKAVFKLTPKIYIMYLNNIKEGDIFKSMQTGSHIKEVNLTGCTEIEATLDYSGGPGQEKTWNITKK